MISINSEIDYIMNLSWKDESSYQDKFSTREAVSRYIENIMGYLHEEYNYANVRNLRY